ncbi:MAG: hypothetical protein ACXABG_06570 [Promethearchaeota archaeon]|jgi:hypothetical protein
MRKNWMKNTIYIFILIDLCLTQFIPNFKADMASIKFTGTGNFFPEENCSLIMTNAMVLFNVDYEEQDNRIDISFNGNYTIFNPEAAQNITLAAPFSPVFKNLESTCVIKIDDSIKAFKFIEHHWSDPWDEYLDSVGLGMSNKRNFILTNATFPENSSVKIEYSFDAYIDQPNSDDRLLIYYDVGTSRAWNGTITECVEFKTYGKLPDSYSNNSDWYNYNFTISSFTNGKSYKWDWVDETILRNSVYIAYYYPFNRFWGFAGALIILGVYAGANLALVFIALKIYKRIKRKRKKSRE